MYLHYFPSYCGGRILTGLSVLDVDTYNRIVGGEYRVSVVTIRADGARTDKANPEPGRPIADFYNGKKLTRPVLSTLTVPNKETARLEIVKNILIQDGLMKCNRISYITTNSWGDPMSNTETFPDSVFSKSVGMFSDPGKPPVEFQHSVPEDLGDFQYCLFGLLKHHGDFKFTYAVTNPTQDKAASFLEASGFKCVGKGAKNAHASVCHSWQGDREEIWSAIRNTMNRERKGLSVVVDQYMDRFPKDDSNEAAK